MPVENDGSQSVDQAVAEECGEGGASAESLVTPEIEARFAEVFGNPAGAMGVS